MNHSGYRRRGLSRISALPKLIVRGHRVRILDLGYFGVESLRSMRGDVD